MEHAIEHKMNTQAKAASALMDILRERDEGDADLVADMVEGETGLFEALDEADREILTCMVTVEGCKAAEADLKARRDRAAARAEKIRSAIEQALMIADIGEKIVRPTATFTLTKRAPGVVIDDESLIPAAYFVPQPPKLDKNALGIAAAAAPVPGCHMDNGSASLTIRRK